MKTLQEMKAELLADGIIDANEVKELEVVLYADGKIDEEEANFLFELNDAVSGKDNDPAWNTLFVKAISSYLLDDENSPGEIDDAEAVRKSMPDYFEKMRQLGAQVTVYEA